MAFRKQAYYAADSRIQPGVCVIIGFQVNGWWAEQLDARQEMAYLAAMKEDFSLISGTVYFLNA